MRAQLWQIGWRPGWRASLERKDGLWMSVIAPAAVASTDNCTVSTLAASGG